MTIRRTVAPFFALALLSAAPLAAQTGSRAVDTKTSVFLAGGNAYTVAPTGGGGVAPVAVNLDPGTGRILTVSATGAATFCPNGLCGTTSPDGPSIGGTALNGTGSLSGISAGTSGFLAGVFLGAGLPGSAPASLNFNAIGTDFTTFAPLIGQVFFIGNGQTSGGVTQQFFVPDAATRLFFGIADGGSFQGNPGFYDDNVGTYNANFTISAVPEPSTWLLVGSGLATLAVVARRRRAT